MEIQKLIIHTHTLPPRPAQSADFPPSLHPDIRKGLIQNHIPRLYSHQAHMFEAAARGEHVVITTATASGKTLGFLLPVLQAVLKDPLTRAIFIYPTKALASDQYRALVPWLEYFGAGRVSAGVYDGDTPPQERSRIRKNANIILTNPEMLNGAFLPNHSRYGFDFIFANLKYVVIDELHSYRGAFGAHLANIFRRLTRVCRYYRSAPQFLCSSATIANPVELAQNICGQTFTLIDKDGSPAPAKEYRILQPPVIKGSNDKIYGRYSASTVASDLITQLVAERRHFIAFGRSRRNVEVILKESRDKLKDAGFLYRAAEDSDAFHDHGTAGAAEGRGVSGGHGRPGQIAGYRGGYTPQERRDIERRMISGELAGLISTNALELGIDIGSLDTTVIVGYPGTRASFWQQTGRAGRSGTACVNYLILENQPFDQYIAIDPDWLFSQASEHAIVDRDNLLIQLSHIRAAAAEMPLSMDDIALFPALGEVIPVLLKAGEVKSLGGRFAWAGPAFPAGDYSLRNMDQTRFKLILDKDGREITEMDETQAHHELYPGAIYIHEGAQYEVLSLDLESRTAHCHPFNGNYYTVPAGTRNTRILQVFQEMPYARTHLRFGDINVDELIDTFKKLQFHNHQNLGYVGLAQPLQKDYDTESTWLELPEAVVHVYRSLLQRNNLGELVRNNHFEGLAYAIKNAAIMVTMASRDDIDTAMSDNALIPDEFSNEHVYLFIYDQYVGGLGFSEKIYDQVPRILENAIRMVKGCACEDGCPACVGDYTLDKKMVLWGLENMLRETPAPHSVKTVVDAEKPAVVKAFSFFSLPEQWRPFCDAVEQDGEPGGAFLKTMKQMRVQDHCLILEVENSFYEQWGMVPENYRSILNIIRYYAVCPSDMQIKITAGRGGDGAHDDNADSRQGAAASRPDAKCGAGGTYDATPDSGQSAAASRTDIEGYTGETPPNTDGFVATAATDHEKISSRLRRRYKDFYEE